MSQIIAQEEIERRIFLALHEEGTICKERLLHKEMMILRHQQMEKEDLMLGNPRSLRGGLDEAT